MRSRASIAKMGPLLTLIEQTRSLLWVFKRNQRSVRNPSCRLTPEADDKITGPADFLRLTCQKYALLLGISKELNLMALNKGFLMRFIVFPCAKGTHGKTNVAAVFPVPFALFFLTKVAICADRELILRIRQLNAICMEVCVSDSY